LESRQLSQYHDGMKITDVAVHGGRIPHLTFVEVRTDEGITGIGVTGSPSCIIGPIIKGGQGDLSRFVIGEDPQEIGRLWRKMFQQWQALRGRGGEGGIAVNAMGAIDMALWDLAGKRLNLPLYKLLGGAIQSQVMAYASGTAFDPLLWKRDTPEELKTAEQLAGESRSFVEQGFRAIKFGWGNHFRPQDEERLAAIREAIGPDTRLMLDFGCPAYWTPGWNAKEAIRAARILERYGGYFLEEPMPPFDVDGHTFVTNAVDIKIATGESLSTIHEFEQLIDRRAVDIVQPDAAQMGVTQVQFVARRAEETGLLCVPHSPWSATVVASHLHILSTVSNGVMVEYPGWDALREKSNSYEITWMCHHDIVDQTLTLSDGYLQLPSGPGLGLGNYVADALSELEELASDGEER
jgi:L-alanine-DL-glutamate epimerase-like enolase superfamily enzyme